MTIERIQTLWRVHRRSKPRLGRLALTLSDAINAYRAETGMNQQKLARVIGVTAGQIHHYESLARLTARVRVALQQDAVVFKEARALADLDPDRQDEIALLFTSGRLSSVQVERAVGLAKEHPGWDADTICKATLGRDFESYMLDDEQNGPSDPEPALDLDLPPALSHEALCMELVRFAGVLRLSMQNGRWPPPEIKRLRLVKSGERAQAALADFMQSLGAGR